MISIQVKFFGPVRDIVGADELTMSLPDQCTGEALLQTLMNRHPRLGEWSSSLRLAVNLEYAHIGRVLEDADEVSFIPPVSGG